MSDCLQSPASICLRLEGSIWQKLHSVCRTVQSRHRRANAKVLTRAMSGPLHHASSDAEKDDEEGEADDVMDDADPEVQCPLPQMQHLKAAELFEINEQICIYALTDLHRASYPLMTWKGVMADALMSCSQPLEGLVSCSDTFTC